MAVALPRTLGGPMDSTILGASISSLIRDHFPFALCHACAAQRLNVSVFDFRNVAQAVAVQADFATPVEHATAAASLAITSDSSQKLMMSPPALPWMRTRFASSSAGRWLTVVSRARPCRGSGVVTATRQRAPLAWRPSQSTSCNGGDVLGEDDDASCSLLLSVGPGTKG